MARHRTYSLEFKRLVAQQYLSGEFALAALARQHDMCRSLIRIWVAKYEAGEFDDESVQGDILTRYEARTADRGAGAQGGSVGHGERVAQENEAPGDPARQRDALRGERPCGLSV